MNEALFSELAQRIGWTLVHSAWQFTIIAVVLAAVLGILRGRSPHLRYALMLITLMAIVVLPAITFVDIDPIKVESSGFATNDLHVTNPGDTTPIVAAVRETSVVTLTDESTGSLRSSKNDFIDSKSIATVFVDWMVALPNLIRQWMNIIVTVWLLGISVLSIRLLVGWRAIRRIRVSGRSQVSESIATMTTRVAERLCVRRAVEVTQSSLVDVPTVIGWLKPLVLLPASAIIGLTSEQLEAVIAHEMAHIRRHDYLVNIFQVLIETVFFYHPAVWWVSQLMRVEREVCCDDIAAEMTGDRVRYAKLLVWLEESRGSFTPVTLGMSADGGSLRNRIGRIVGLPLKATGVGPFVIAATLTFVTCVGCFLVMTSSSSTAQETTSQDVDALRGWMTRAVELEEWGRLSQLAREMAEAKEYDEALDWLSKAPLGKSRDGNLDPKFYYRVVAEICETALKHDQLDFAMGVLDGLNDPDNLTETHKMFPPRQDDVRIAILTHHLSNGQIDQAFGFIESQPIGTQPSIVNRAVGRATGNGHGNHIEAFWRRLTDPQSRYVCERELANAYYRLHEPGKIWRLADEISNSRPDDFIAEVRVRNLAMHYYALMSWESFEQRLPAYRAKLAQLADDDQDRYENRLAL